jgi:hypothetical protein
LGRTLPSTLTFDFPNVSALVEYLAEEILALEPMVQSPSSVQNGREYEDFQAIEQLSELEAEATLLRELDELEGRTLSS